VRGLGVKALQVSVQRVAAFGSLVFQGLFSFVQKHVHVAEQMFMFRRHGLFGERQNPRGQVLLIRGLTQLL